MIPIRQILCRRNRLRFLVSYRCVSSREATGEKSRQKTMRGQEDIYAKGGKCTQQTHSEGFPRKQVVLVGDSLTEIGFRDERGWGLELTKRYLRRCDVINRGLYGWNTRWLKMAMEKNVAFLPPQMHFGTLLMGSNDAVLRDMNPGQHVPMDEFEQNLLYIAAEMLRRAEKGIVLIAPPPCNPDAWAEFVNTRKPEFNGKSDRTNELLETYGAIVKQVKQTLQERFPEKFVRLFDAYELLKEEDLREKSLLYDGVHFGQKAQILFFDKLWEILQSENLTLESVDDGFGHESYAVKIPGREIDAANQLPLTEPTFLEVMETKEKCL
uniref:SGNH hydrolase-type esterase domain-containing protein n=1 Tax=Ditylum brightwellii TaxID=49249 RepID=A0A6V2HNC7_9STRA|mmetsp:Transcript_7978/g.11248  ORF Transcript_7978/g.11248 Transcript_7978/m.11248 type:complete len:325 (+) Transcript_7978:167-1141(+)